MATKNRNKHWVESQIQGALAIRVLLQWAVFAIIAASLTFSLQYLGDPLASVSTHWSNLWSNQGMFVVVMIILLPAFIYDTIKLSNRFAGPVVRMRLVMRQIAEGKEVEKLKFRDGDFWGGLAEDFNALIDKGYLVGAGPAKSAAESSSSTCNDADKPEPVSV